MKKALFLFLIISYPSWAQGAESPQTQALRTKVVEFARGFLGTPYVYGAASPEGFDCTGLVYYTYQKIAALLIPRSTRALAQFGEKITQEQALPGDVFIFNTVGGPSHAGLYIGDSQVLHAASAGSKTGVIISSMKENYYATRFLYGRRILPGAGTPVSPVASVSESELPLTTLDIPLGRRSLRNYDRLPFLAGTLVEFEIQMNRSDMENLQIIFVKGDYEKGTYEKLWEESRRMSSGEIYRTRETKVEGVSPWTLVVLNSQGEERGLRIFRSVLELSK